MSDYGVITQMEYSPTLAGYAMVLSTGHAVFVIPSSSSDGKVHSFPTPHITFHEQVWCQIYGIHFSSVNVSCLTF